MNLRTSTMARRRPTAARLGPKAGFTLLEVLVALMVFTGVLASLFATWTIVLRSNTAALRLTAEAQRARMAIRTLEDAIVAAEMVAGLNGRHYSFLVDTSNEFAMLSFVGHMSDSFPGSGYFGDERVRRITFAVEENQLLMEQNSILASLDEKNRAYPLVLARDVRMFTLDFWEPRRSEWIPEWPPMLTNTLPRLIRVTLGVGTSNKKQPDQIVSRIISLPGAGIQAGLQGMQN